MLSSPSLRLLPIEQGHARHLFKPTTLALTIVLALAQTAMSAQAAAPVTATASAARKSYTIAPGPLDLVLARFAAAADMPLSFDPALVGNRQSAGINGSYTGEGGLRLLLEGSGLGLEAKSGGGYTLHRLPPVSATASKTTVSAEVPTLSVVKVIENSAYGPAIGYTARRSATATKTDVPLNEIPRSVTVVTAEQIQDQRAESLQDVLKYSAGVSTGYYGVNNRDDWFLVRGGSEGAVVLDGLRRPRPGWYPLVKEEPFALERVEVLRGPASVMAGQNAPGGVVSLVSKRPLAEAQHQLTVQVGEFDHKKIGLDMTGPMSESGEWLYRLVAVGLDSGSQVDYAFDRRELLAPSLSWKPGGGTQVTAYAEYQNDRSRHAASYFPIESMREPQTKPSVPMNRFTSEPDWDRYGGTRWRVGYEWEQQLNDNWLLRNRVRYDQIDGALRSMYTKFWESFMPDGRSIGRRWLATDETSKVLNADLSAEGVLTTGPLKHHVLIGVDGMRQNSERSYWQGDATPLDLYTPQYGKWTAPVLQPGSVVAGLSGRTQVSQWGVLLQDRINVNDQLILTGSLRYDNARTTVQENAPGQDSAVTKNLGLVYKAGNDLSPYVGYSESFEPLAGKNEDGSFYKPKRGKQVEAGVKWHPATVPLTASVAAYKLNENNRIIWAEKPGLPNTQAGSADVNGVELEMAAHLRAWDIIANYSMTHSKDNTDGLAFVRTPEKTANLWAVHKLDSYGAQGWRVGFGTRYTGAMWDTRNVTQSSSNLLVDGLIGANFGHWEMTLNITNLMDKKHLTYCDVEGCWYGAKRKAALTANYYW